MSSQDESRSPGAGQPIPDTMTASIAGTTEMSTLEEAPSGAGRPIPEDPATPSKVSKLKKKGRRLTQRTLFQFGRAATRVQHGQSKRTQDFTRTTEESIPWGDPLLAGADAQTAGYFRIMSHNVHGLSKANFQIDVVDFARAINDKAIGLFGIQETNRNFERRHMLDSFHSVLRGISSHHQGAVSSAKLPWPSDYQPGGTAVSVRNKWASRFLSKGSDDLGRWSWVTLTGQGTTKITFISGYRVCDGAPESSITSRTVRSQQEWIYADRGLPQVNLRKQFVDDIIKMIGAFQKSGHEIVLMFDANEKSGTGSAADTISLACGLRDAHSLSSDTTRPPATHQRGSDKIDFILVSPRAALSIRAASILAFHDGYLSDHRSLIVDFDAASLFAGITSAIVPPPSRLLTSTNPIAVSAYVKHMVHHINYHRIEERASWLMERSETGQWGPEEVAEWERVDDSLVQARRASEAKCPKKRSGQHPWSPDFDKAGKRLLYWRLRLRELSSVTATNQDLLRSLEQALSLDKTDVEQKTSSALYDKVQQARKLLRTVKSQAAELREHHLAESAKLSAALQNTSIPAACAAIRAREKSSRQFRELRSTLRTSTSAGLERIDVPNTQAVLRLGETVPRIPLVTKEEIEEVLIPHTERRFTQHQETPFGHGYRQRSLGIDCTSRDATDLRQGTYDYKLAKLTEEARTWLTELRTKEFAHGEGIISCAISTDDIIEGWSKMRESTSSAPGGHYGHYKTASVVARLPIEHEDHTRVLAEIYAKMMTLPLKHGFAPKRWCHCIDAILEKIPGKPIIEKLRIIMLYEADFNFALKLIWGKRLVKNAERFHCLGTSNHGSRKGRQTSDAQLEKLLLYEISRLTRTSLVTVDNDAKSCYDRILKPLSMTACIAVGLPLSAASMHNNTHHRMVHQIKSRHGLLRPYSGTDDNAHEGTGQGSGASPAIWLIYMVTLLNAFAHFSPGMKVRSPYQNLSVLILAIFFVDDGMPGVNDASDAEARPLGELLNSAEHITQAWERLLFVSGGALELIKCFAYVMYWDLSGGTHRLLRPDEIPGCTLTEGGAFSGPIALTYGDKSDKRHFLDTVSPWTGRRTLGVRIAPAGTWSDELQYRRSQARDLALLIAGAVLPPDTARLGYHMMVCPKIEFPLTVSQFTQKECDSISSSCIRACLSKMAYNCNMPREVVYGPTALFGIGMHDLYVEQGIKQVSALVGHLRQDSETGRMMQIELQWCQMQAGTKNLLLTNTEISIDYIETCWIMGIRDFLRTYDLKIDLTDESTPQATQRIADEFIMDALRTRGDCTATELQRLNACRLYLQVARISDIASIDGTKIREGPLKGIKDGLYISAINWPRQGRPPQLWWTLWKRKLKRVFSSDGTSVMLRRKLGTWTDGMIITEWSTATCVVNGHTEAYDRLNDGRYSIRVDTSQSRTGKHHWVHDSLQGEIDILPAGTVPASLGPAGKKNRMRRVHRSPTESVPADREQMDDTSTEFSQFVAKQPDHIRQIMRDVDTDTNIANRIAQLLTTSSLVHGGTDGGLSRNDGTFGFAWSDGSTIYASGMGHTTGSSDSMSSTRAELSGILAAITYLRLVIEHNKVQHKHGIKCILHCDSRAALQRVGSFAYEGFGTSWRCRANYDLEVAIKVCLKSLPFKVHWEWVRGHAHRRKQSADFTWPEVLNSHADAMATEAKQRQHSQDHRHWPEQTVSVLGPRGRITGHLGKEIRYCCTSRDIISYWRGRYSWTAAQAATVDILSTQSIAKKLSAATTRRVQKLRCGWLPVNSRESRQDPDQPAGCVACSSIGLVPETVDHLFQCRAPSRRKAVREAFARFHPAMRELKTPECIISAIRLGVLSWIEDRETPSVESLNLPETEVGRLTAQAFSEQSALGWNVLLRGFWSQSWRQAQEAQFRRNRFLERQDTGEQWSAKAQLWFIDLFESLWGLRNEDQHGVDSDTERLVRATKCERAIRRLYAKGAGISYCESHPFRYPVEDLLNKPVTDQELWILQTERYLPKAFRRIRDRGRDRQHAITEFFIPLT